MISRRLGTKWTEPELIVVVDMYFNGGFTDSHGFDAFARCLGRYNANTNSHNDGGVNQKLAEIKGYVEGVRAPRHPGGTIIALIERYGNNRSALRTDAVPAWRNVLRGYSGPLPEYVQQLLGNS